MTEPKNKAAPKKKKAKPKANRPTPQQLLQEEMRAKDPESLTIKQTKGETVTEALTYQALTPTMQAALTLRQIGKSSFPAVGYDGLITKLQDQCKKVHDGDLKRSESMLIAQAHTLDAIFNDLVRRSLRNMGEYLNAADTFMRLALKAQSQCRTTLEAISEIKNPRSVSYVRQANVSHGPQQVNNHPTANDSRGREKQSPQTKKLEDKHGERLDTRAPVTTIPADSRMEALEENDWTENAGRQGTGCT